MSTSKLLQPILDDGVHHTHFFHGRLLSAADLQAEQDAYHHHQAQLGRALGAGVVAGLEVKVENDGAGDGPPVLAVGRGLAIDLKGRTLELAQDAKIALARQVEPSPETGGFTDCLSLDTDLMGVGDGVYVLLLAPASGFEERAPKSGLEDDGRVAGCGSRYRVEGVKFRLAELELGATAAAGLLGATRSQLAELSKLRNTVAHLCFGSQELAGFAGDPFARSDGKSPYLAYGLLDELRRLGQLDDCEVPLALFSWSLERVQYLDSWSVRRRPAGTVPSAAWPTLTGDRRRAEAEARLLQFQEHLEWLMQPAVAVNPATIRATDYFRYLPPAGLLPLRDSARPRGFASSEFFAGRTVRGPVHAEGAGLHGLIAGSFERPPIDLAEKQVTWLYWLRQNRQPGAGANAASSSPVLLFSSTDMPYWGRARFDVSHFNFSNYASRLA